MTEIVRSALQHLSIWDDSTLFDVRTGNTFDAASYSRLKYGDASVARTYGIELAKHFVAQFPALAFSSDRVIVTGPSYKYLSTAAQGIAETFGTVLNAARVRAGYEPTTPLHIIRAWVGSDTYAMASLEERQRQLPAGGQHVDHGLVKDSVVIVIDDVSITGSTERAIQLHMEPAQPKTLCFLHVAEVNREEALQNASIENVINKTITPTLGNFLALIEEDNFRLNSRVFRTIMETSTTDMRELNRFFSKVPSKLLLAMYDALVSGTVEMYNRYPAANDLLEQKLASRQLLADVALLDSYPAA